MYITMHLIVEYNIIVDLLAILAFVLCEMFGFEKHMVTSILFFIKFYKLTYARGILIYRTILFFILL